jgi:hypothetical protein
MFVNPFGHIAVKLVFPSAFPPVKTFFLDTMGFGAP